jgi:protein DGCR14
MFGPDADVDPLKRPPRPVLTSADLRQDPPEISHRNTRLPDDEENDGRPTGGRSSARASSPSRSRVGAAISGTPCEYRMLFRLCDSDSTLLSISDRSNDSMPTFNNYALVPDAPSPSPEQLGPQAVSQLMTWGSLMSTPRALGEASGSTDNGPNVFKLNEPDRRDKLARKLANNASRAMKERAKGFGIAPRGLAVLSGSSRKPGSMGPPSTHGSIFDREGSVTPRRNADSLTPAGRTLLERSMGTPISASRRAGTGVGSGGGASRGRVEAMERSGGWSNLGSNSKRKEPAARSWYVPGSNRILETLSDSVCCC